MYSVQLCTKNICTHKYTRFRHTKTEFSKLPQKRVSTILQLEFSTKLSISLHHDETELDFFGRLQQYNITWKRGMAQIRRNMVDKVQSVSWHLWMNALLDMSLDIVCCHSVVQVPFGEDIIL